MLIFYNLFLFLFTIKKVIASVENSVKEKFRKILCIWKYFLCLLNTEMFHVYSCLMLIWVLWCLIGALVCTFDLHCPWWSLSAG